MADTISLHWGFDQITILAPAKGADRVVALKRPDSAVDPSALGRWLKTELGAARISAKKAAIVLPRSAAVFRKLSLPNVPEDELPDLVRMQAATKSPTPLDRLRLDFVPMPQRGDGRDVLLATISTKAIDDVLSTVRAAGLEPASIGISSFAVADRLAAGAGTTLLVTIEEQTAEITIVRDGSVIFAHAADLPGGDSDEDRQWLKSEISRSVVAADHLSSGAGITRVVLLGPAELLQPLSPSLAERYEGEVEVVSDPASLGVSVSEGQASVAATAAAAGQLLSGTPRLDFLAPRRRIEKPDRRRLHMGLVAGGAAAALLTAYAMTWMKQSDLDREIAQLRHERTAHENTLTRGAAELKAHNDIRDWMGRHATWTAEMASLDESLPGTDRLYLSELSLDANAGVRDSHGQVKGAGAAKEHSDVQALYDALAAQGYRVSPNPSTESRRDPEYPIQFVLDLSIPKPAPPSASSSPSPSGTAPAG